MAREVEGALFRVNCDGGHKFVDCSSRDDLLDYCARQVAHGSVILVVNEIRRDGSTPKVPVLTDKKFKRLVQEYQQEAEREAQDEPKVVRTMDELEDYLESKDWTVYKDDADWDIGKYSPAGEDFFFNIRHDNNVEKAIKEIKEYANDFDIEQHVELNLGGRGAPGVVELVEDAKAIQEMLDELADGVNWCEMETIKESCERLGSLNELIQSAEVKAKASENTEQEICLVNFRRVYGVGLGEFNVKLDIMPEEYLQGKEDFSLNADERVLAYDKAAEVVGENELSDFVIFSAEMIKDSKNRTMGDFEER